MELTKGDEKKPAIGKQYEQAGEGEILVAMDVWEHSYYLKHKSQRAKYIDDFFKVLCWRSAEKRYQQIING